MIDIGGLGITKLEVFNDTLYDHGAKLVLLGTLEEGGGDQVELCAESEDQPHGLFISFCLSVAEQFQLPLDTHPDLPVSVLADVQGSWKRMRE